MSNVAGNSSGASVEHAICPGCGRLMADETGALCDQCDPSIPVVAPLPTTGLSANGLLIAVTIVISSIAGLMENDGMPFGAAFGPGVASGQCADWQARLSRSLCFLRAIWQAHPARSSGSQEVW